MTPAVDKAGPAGMPEWADLGLAMLAVGAGSMDVFGFFALGGALPSAMTGNTALLGLALGQRFDSDSATGTTLRSPLTGLCSMTLSTAKNNRFDGKIGADAVFLVNVKGLRSTAWDRPREGEKMLQGGVFYVAIWP